MAQLDSHLAQLTYIFQTKGGVAGQKLAKHLEILQEETNYVNPKRTAVLKALCIYLGEDEGQLVLEYMAQNTTTKRSGSCAVNPDHSTGSRT
uniref:Uncharacterized protein n=1 Tax=Gasterosteus aculeatus TaxID=69293 RepID=G3NCA7_GASAC